MPTTVNIHEAKTHLSRLLESVERGEEVIIARAGHPIAVLSAYTPPRRKIAPPGGMKDRGWWISDDFNDPIDDLFDCLRDDSDANELNAKLPE